MENIIYPLIGGVLIGFSSSTMLGGLGRITGISGIVSSSLARPQRDLFWRYKFLLGLLMGGIIMKFSIPELFNYQFSESPYKIIIAGLLVGFGTTLGNGCTSGHGVCGLARKSKRSFVATITFMGFGIITVAIMRFLS